MVMPTTPTGTSDPKTDADEGHVLPSAGRMASATPTTTTIPESATPKAADMAETECGPSTASQ